MKPSLSLFLFTFLTVITFAQYSDPNFALHLDGKDNNVCTGIGIMKAPWTLEAWIKGNDRRWKNTEVIFGGGEYSKLNRADNVPLIIKKGKLGNSYAALWSEKLLDTNWHHVALSCNDTVTTLYVDGAIAGSKQIAFSILPGALGVHIGKSTVFNGLIDEVRIWDHAVAHHELKRWMNRPLTSHHPDFKSLVAYYNFDDGTNNAGINWVGKGWQANHLRNERNNYKGSAALAYTVINTNVQFTKRRERQQLFNAVVIHNEWDCDQGSQGFQVLRLRIAVTGILQTLYLTGLALDLSQVSHLSDISRIHVYDAGKNATSAARRELFTNGIPPGKMLHLSEEEKSIPLSPGINYFIITADIAKNAIPGGKIKISVPSVSINNRIHIPEESNDLVIPEIISNHKTNAEIVKVLQWNIWHGGVHLGDEGVNRVIHVLKESHADIITMQEAYGSQQRIADSLGYFMYAVSPKDNLAVFSRYKITPLPHSYNTFNSNPVMIALPNGKNLLVNTCWLRYSTAPEYTSVYPDKGYDPAVWASEDSVNALADIRNIIEKDTKPYAKDDIPVIIGGDFNSCSHLDWTKAAAPLHFGYGPVAFPVSDYLLGEGYKDSFREMHPNEVERPEGTWSPIYGQLPFCRIDFLYYKGASIKSLASKIIRTTPDIDDLWPSDHAAVLTTFEVTNGL